MKLKPVPKALLILAVVSGIGFAGYKFMDGKPEPTQVVQPVVEAPVVKQAPVAVAPAPVAAPAQVVVEPATNASTNRGMTALMNTGKNK